MNTTRENRLEKNQQTVGGKPMRKERTFQCVDCQQTVRVKAVAKSLRFINKCPQCYTKAVMIKRSFTLMELMVVIMLGTVLATVLTVFGSLAYKIVQWSLT